MIGKTDAVEKVLDYLYLGKIVLSMSCINDILEVVDYLQFSNLKTKCNNYLMRIPLTSATCVKICLISSQYDLPIHERALKYMKGHLFTVLLGQDILTLTKESVQALLIDETLSYVPQEKFLQFLVQWLKYDLNARKEEFLDMCKLLKMQDVSESVMNTILEDKDLKEHLQDNDFKSIFKDSAKKNGRKQPFGRREVILIGGGKFCEPNGLQVGTDKLYAFSLVDEKWSEIFPLPGSAIESPIIRSGNNGNIYCIDKTKSFWNYNLYVFEIASKCWQRTNIQYNDQHFGLERIHDVVICGNRVFLLGICVKEMKLGLPSVCCLIEVKANGSFETFYLFDCDIKDKIHGCQIDDEKVGIVCEMFKKKRFSIKYYNLQNKTVSEPTRAKSCLSTPHFTKILIHKGDIILVDLKKKIIRKFNPSKNVWISYPKMSCAPIELTMSAMYSFYSDELYVFGGENTKQSYKYLCNKKIWIELEDMPVPSFLSNAATAVTNLPVKLVACHLNCPHCFYVGKYPDVTYPSPGNSDSEDEEEYQDSDYDDCHYYDSDDGDRRSECSLM